MASPKRGLGFGQFCETEKQKAQDPQWHRLVVQVSDG